MLKWDNTCMEKIEGKEEKIEKSKIRLNKVYLYDVKILIILFNSIYKYEINLNM